MYSPVYNGRGRIVEVVNVQGKWVYWIELEDGSLVLCDEDDLHDQPVAIGDVDATGRVQVREGEHPA